jgi:hypothetical protein
MIVKVGEVCGSYAILLNGSWYAVWYGKLSRIGFSHLKSAAAYLEECDRKIACLMS